MVGITLACGPVLSCPGLRICGRQERLGTRIVGHTKLYIVLKHFSKFLPMGLDPAALNKRQDREDWRNTG